MPSDSFFGVFFSPSFGGTSPNKCSYTFHLNLRCHCRKAEQSSSGTGIPEIPEKMGFVVLWEGNMEQNSQGQFFFLFLYITMVRIDAHVCACEAITRIPLLFLKVIFFSSFLPLQLQQVYSLGLSLLVLIGFNISKLPSHL